MQIWCLKVFFVPPSILRNKKMIFNLMCCCFWKEDKICESFLAAIAPQVDAGLKADCDSDRQARRRGPCVSAVVCADTRLLIRCVEPVRIYRTSRAEPSRKESVKAIDTLQRYSNFSPPCPSIKCFKDNQQQMPKSPSKYSTADTHWGNVPCVHMLMHSTPFLSPSHCLHAVFGALYIFLDFILYIEQIKRDV